MTAKSTKRHSKGYTELDSLYQEGYMMLNNCKAQVDKIEPEKMGWDSTQIDQFMRLKKALGHDVDFYQGELDKIKKKHAKFKGAPKTQEAYAMQFKIGNLYIDVNSRILSTVPAIVSDILAIDTTNTKQGASQ